VRFLIDECLAQRVGELLAASGHDAVHVSDIGLLGAVDELVMAAAEADSRVVVSADTDFGGLLAKSGAKQPSVILFRREDRHAECRGCRCGASRRRDRERLHRGDRRRPNARSDPAARANLMTVITPSTTLAVDLRFSW
jgi:predicted nuclease of predicted toxin-antitoxin system